MKHNFRDILPAADDPRVAGICDRDACQHVEHALRRPRVQAVTALDNGTLFAATHGIGVANDIVGMMSSNDGGASWLRNPMPVDRSGS